MRGSAPAPRCSDPVVTVIPSATGCTSGTVLCNLGIDTGVVSIRSEPDGFDCSSQPTSSGSDASCDNSIALTPLTTYTVTCVDETTGNSSTATFKTTGPVSVSTTPLTGTQATATCSPEGNTETLSYTVGYYLPGSSTPAFTCPQAACAATGLLPSTTYTVMCSASRGAVPCCGPNSTVTTK